MVRNRILSLAAITSALALAACAASPLYVQTDQHRGTAGDVPRDGTGEPMFTDITVPLPAPPTPYVAPAPGIPVTGPGALAFDAATLPPPPGPAFTLAQRTPKEIRQEERRKRRACRHLRSCN
ncbi:hypothetical protein KX816_06770 [Sphingosinicellaceae bacterium]|nr:hypothetical protein KX816_06770 [Sphingosinicellaceae bacterium]